MTSMSNVSEASTDKPFVTLDTALRHLTTHWSGSGEGTTRIWDPAVTTILFSVDITAFSYQPEVNYPVNMTSFMESQAELAFELWDDVTARPMQRTYDESLAYIKFDHSTSPNLDGTSGWAVPSPLRPYGPGGYSFTGVEIWVNHTYQGTDTGYATGAYGFDTYIHEIGHALGLSHPGAYNALDGHPSYAADALMAQDTKQYSIMSYFSETNSGANYQGSNPSTPLLYDIAAIQAKYGADMTTRTGNTSYGFNNTADRDLYDFTQNAKPVFCIWDASGNDTINASEYSMNQVFDLRAGGFSSIGGLTNNISIAFNCSIENAVGGSGNDLFYGNGSANAITGGAGVDTVFMSLEQSAYTFSGSAGNFSAVAGGISSDRFSGIERLVFKGSSIGVEVSSLFPPPPPTDDFRNVYNDTTLPLGSVAINGQATGSIEVGGDRDVFAFNTTAGQTYRFDLVGGSLSDTNLRILNAAGQQIAANDDYGVGFNSQLTFAATVSGVIFLEASGSHNVDQGTYRLASNLIEPPPPAVDDFADSLFDSTSPLGSLTMGGAVIGEIEEGGDLDVFAFQLGRRKSCTIDVAGLGLDDPYVRVFGPRGKLIAQNDDYLDGLDSHIVLTGKRAATYYIEVSSAAVDGVGDYQVSLRPGRFFEAERHAEVESLPTEVNYIL